MIQVASHPADLSKWNQREEPFYLEVFGETEPVLDMTFAEMIPPGSENAQTTQSTPIYEYWWTLGHGGYGKEHHHLFGDRADRKDPKDEVLWTRLEDIAARVYLYFPISGGWRAKELVATVKYLSPVADQKDWSAKAAEDFQKVQPFLAGAGQLAGAGGVPLAAPVLSVLSKLQIGTVPQVRGFNWYTEKVTFGAAADHGVMQGVGWALPKKMFELMGGRLTGSIALSFVPSQSQEKQDQDWTPEPLPMLAHAVVYADGKQHWAPAKNKFVELTLKPTEKAVA